MRISANRIAFLLTLTVLQAGSAAAQTPSAPATAPSAAASDPAPIVARDGAATVKRLQDVLLAVMQNAAGLGYEGRRLQLAPVLSEVFDFEGMIRFAVSGAIWNTLPAQQQQRLIDAFAAMSIATYAERFNGFSNEKFVLAETQEAPRGAVIVKTRIEPEGQPPVLLNYVLREIEGRWRIFDVVFEGKYSEMATRREEYGAIIKREGIDALVAHLERAARDAASRG
jgi:phospholipid transport system substrate-binding protein